MELIRKLLPYMSVLVLIAFGYAGWTFWSRHEENQRIEQAAKDAEARRAAEITRVLGGDNLKILTFYASPATVAPGGRTLVCYGVSNAKSVRIEPYLDDLKPAISRCLEVHPTADTQYKLTAVDAKGREAVQSFTLHVSH